MAQWLRIRLPMEETKWIPGPEDSTYHRATTEALASSACAPQEKLTHSNEDSAQSKKRCRAGS